MQSALWMARDAQSPCTSTRGTVTATPFLHTPARELVVCVGSLVDVQTPLSTSTTAAPSSTSGCLKRPRADSGTTRQSKRRMSSPARPAASVLSKATWNRIQQTMLLAKSLRNITRVTLAFFKEQETAQLGRGGIKSLTCPVPVPLAEVYSMLMPKKRRVYDVLHVLEGVGVLKRVHDTCDPKASRFRHGQFLYYGKMGALERLQGIRKRAQELAREARRVCPRMTRQKLDTVLLNACNIQAQIEGWSILTTTTVAFLTLLLESDDGVVASLGTISRRIVDARLVCDAAVPSEVEIHRRVYDLASVLTSINAVVLSDLSNKQKKEATRRVGYATPRKGVAFNAAIFSNSKLLLIGESCSLHLESLMQRERVHAHETASAAAINLPANAIRCTVTLPNFTVDEHSLEDLFPEIDPIETPENVVDWWNVALRGLLLRDALPLSDCLDWEIIQAIARARESIAVSQARATYAAPPTEGDIDLVCHEELKAA